MVAVHRNVIHLYACERSFIKVRGFYCESERVNRYEVQKKCKCKDTVRMSQHYIFCKLFIKFANKIFNRNNLNYCHLLVFVLTSYIAHCVCIMRILIRLVMCSSSGYL